MFKFLKLAALALVVPAVIIGDATVFAVPAGQIEGGDIYRVRNVTKNTAFTDPVAADKCETVQFKVRIHNPGPDPLTGVNVKATLPSTAATSHSSQATVSATNANPPSTSDTAGVTLPAAYKIAYAPGTTQLLDPNNSVLQNLPDGIVGGGVNLPDGVGVSLQQIRFVQFQAKLECPEVPPKSVVCDALTAENIGSTNVPAKIKFTAKGTTTGDATINGYVFDFGDGAKEDSSNAVIEHTYSKEGDYKATVQVKSTLGLTDVVAHCSVVIKVTKDKPPVVVPPTTVPSVPGAPGAKSSPSVLPSTGPAEIVSGLFGASSLGYGVRQWLMSRRRLGNLFNQ